MKRLDRLTAVNKIMELKTAERISTNTELATIPQAVLANELLDFHTDKIQTDFKWFYTGQDDGQLVTDVNGEIVTPDDLSYITIYRTDSPVEPQHLVPVDGKIFDKYNNTYNLGTGKTVWFVGKRVWAFEKLPSAFQYLAIAAARLDTASGGAHFSPTRVSIEQKSFNDALQTAQKFDDTLSGGRVRNPMTNRRMPPNNRNWL